MNKRILVFCLFLILNSYLLSQEVNSNNPDLQSDSSQMKIDSSQVTQIIKNENAPRNFVIKEDQDYQSFTLPEKFQILEAISLKDTLRKIIIEGLQYTDDPTVSVIAQLVNNSLGYLNMSASKIFVPEWEGASITLRDLKNKPGGSEIIKNLLSLREEQILDLSDIPWHYIVTSEFNKIRLTSEHKIKWQHPKEKYERLTSFINEYFTLFGGERLGLPIDKNLGIGLTMGLGTPYSGPLETNFYEANFHLLGGSAGLFNSFGDVTEFSNNNNFNNIYSTLGFQLSYSIPIILADLVRIQYQQVINEISSEEKKRISNKAIVTSENGEVYEPKFLEGNYLNFEVRFPIMLLASPWGKLYFARYQNEWHIGSRFYELSLGNRIASKFDFRFDWMIKDTDHIRRPQINMDLLVSNLFESFAKDFAFGPSLSISKLDNNKYGLLKVFANLRIKLNEKPVK